MWMQQFAKLFHPGMNKVPTANMLRPEPGRYLELARTAGRECDRLLLILSPRAAISQWRTIPPATLSVLNDAGVMDRFRWVLGAKASGDSADLVHLTEYFEYAARWWAASFLADCFRHPIDDDTDLALSVDAMPGRQFLSRTTSMTIRYQWASEMITTEIARQIRADPDFAELLPDFTVTNVDRIIDAAHRYGEGDRPITPLDDKGMALATLMAIEAKDLAAVPFEKAVLDRRFEVQPWVRFEDGLSPCAVLQVLFSMERSMINAADNKLFGNGKEKVDKGELFERVAQQCISQTLNAGRRNIKRPYNIKLDPRDKEATDIDIAIIESTVQVVGEAKAMEVSDGLNVASNNFEKQIGQVYDQLTKRIAALDSGMPLIDGQQSPYRGAENVIGIGVVLHPYSSSLGDPRMLARVTGSADTARIAVADLHSWVLILSAMHGVNELRHYLTYRDQIRQLEALTLEECDFALGFFSPHRDEALARNQQLYQNRDVENYRGGAGLPSAVSVQTGLERKKPKDPAKWRRTFFRDCPTMSIF